MKRKKGFTSLIVIVAIAFGWLAYTLTWGGKTPNLGLDLQEIPPKGPLHADPVVGQQPVLSAVRARGQQVGIAEVSHCWHLLGLVCGGSHHRSGTGLAGPSSLAHTA